jgi:hypothetical protein
MFILLASINLTLVLHDEETENLTFIQQEILIQLKPIKQLKINR